LQEAGVELVVENRGVGENLNDHTVTGIVLVSLCARDSGKAVLITLLRASKMNTLVLKLWSAIQR
jgi:hypothetical protein